MSLSSGAASWLSLAYLWHPCPSPLWNAGMVPCGGQWGTSAGGETGGGGSNSEGMRWAVSQEEGGGKRGGGRERKREGGKRKESQRWWRGGIRGQEKGKIGRWFQSLGLDQLLSGGGSLCILFFFILSRYSCWDTASTEARISSSSQSFRPKAEGDIC